MMTRAKTAAEDKRPIAQLTTGLVHTPLEAELLEALTLCVIRDPSLRSNAVVMAAIAKAQGRF